MTAYRLEDRYRATTGTIFATGIGALARIPVEQLRRDRAAGRNTAAFVSGYPGSPLGGIGSEIERARRTVPELPIVHLQSVNEEIGASAVMGSQLAATRPDCTYDGVVGIWYGKAPGLDRATDALRHGVFAGSSATGGAIALVGDDPSAKSSTMPSSSDAALVDLHMPVLYPADVTECLELGLHGIAMSRATGLWSSLKIVTPVADGTGTIELPVLDEDPVVPALLVEGHPWRPHPSAQFLGPRMVAVEREFHEIRLDLARRYGIVNHLNRITVDPPDAWIGIVATGYTYTQVVEALRQLGLERPDAIREAGIRLLQLRLPVPFDAEQMQRFARGLDEIVVVEEKNPTLERLVRDCLYEAEDRPRVVGKFAPDGRRILPSHGLLDADAIAPALRGRLEGVLGDRLAPPPPPPRPHIPLDVTRAPFFCSGCPHNWGTKVPDGAVVGMGTGCHGMTLLMDADRVGESIGITAMGNEGTQWLGMAPFVETPHVFQNMGDGTYFHSGQLAIQAAIGAGVDVTYKILYNHTVAMTGGQDAAHHVGPGALARILLAHGASRVVVTSDDPDRYADDEFPPGVEVVDRTRIVEVQEELATVPGVTILIHDQACAAELRRARKRGRLATPTTRVVVNHRVCEGCGDCGDVSNCLSVQPVDTPLGRRTRIDQATCNLDLSCLQGDCPAFMTVEVEPDHDPVASVADPGTVPVDEPEPVEREVTTVRLAGIGGTGVVTAAQVLGTAAMIAGFHVDGVDQTGLSQKAGPVVSDVVITRPAASRRSNLLGRGQADVLCAFDLLVAADDPVAAVADAGRTVAFASTSTTPTGRQVVHPDLVGPDTGELLARLADHSRACTSLDAAGLAVALTGTAATANTLLLGVAVQSGEIPVPPAAVREAIELNGVAVDANIAAFEWGRRAAVDPERVYEEAAGRRPAEPRLVVPPAPAAVRDRITGLGLPTELAELVTTLAADLVAYQDVAYALRFCDLVARAASLGDDVFTGLVARNAHHLMAYKDEYEVARLLLSPDGLEPALELAGGRRSRIRWHLHPPTLRRRGLGRKIAVTGRAAPLLGLLARARRLRGTRFDPFGRNPLRRLERQLVDEYEAAIAVVCDALEARGDGGGPDRDGHPGELREAARALAALPDTVRGFEELKVRRAHAYRDRLAREVAALTERAAATPAT